MTIVHVKQRDHRGCGPACLAMLLGVDYVTALEIGSPFGVKRSGTSRTGLDLALALRGYAVRRLPGLLAHAPFADAHLVEVVPHGRTGRGWHFVVMDRAGTVFDPWHDAPIAAEVGLSVFASVRCISSVHKVTA